VSEVIYCVECGASFGSRKSLHAHLKAHSMFVGDYYVKNFPKYDLLTGEPIPFKNYEAYSSTDFKSKKNMYKWLDKSKKHEVDFYCERLFRRHMQDREMRFAPSYLYFLTHPRLPKIDYYDRNHLLELNKEFKLEGVFSESIDSCPDFLDIPDGVTILQDTREQNPLLFPNLKTELLKLDFGDYTLGGKDYSYVFVDRKAEDDFKGTMSKGFERFCRELDRVREFGAYLYLVVESDFVQMYANNAKFGNKVNLVYTWENMRNIIVRYSDVCQFVFTSSRQNSCLLIPYLLANGEKYKRVDLQYHLEKYKCLG